MRSRDLEVALASDCDTDGVTIVQDEPLALDVLAVMPRLVVGEG